MLRLEIKIDLKYFLKIYIFYMCCNSLLEFKETGTLSVFSLSLSLSLLLTSEGTGFHKSPKLSINELVQYLNGLLLKPKQAL